MRHTTWALACLFVSLVAITCNPPVRTVAGCEDGETEACACDTGAEGSRTCGEDQLFGACVCTGTADAADDGTDLRDAADDQDGNDGSSDGADPGDGTEADADGPDESGDPDVVDDPSGEDARDRGQDDGHESDGDAADSTDSTDSGDEPDATDAEDGDLLDASDLSDGDLVDSNDGSDGEDPTTDLATDGDSGDLDGAGGDAAADGEVDGDPDVSPDADVVEDPDVCVPTSCSAQGWTCGVQSIGCTQTEDCGDCSGNATCPGTSCVCPDDGAEVNDLQAVPHELDDIPFEDDGSQITYDDDFWLDDDTDVDWFEFYVDDVADATPTTDVLVTLSNIPTDSDYNLSIFFDCEGTATAPGSSCTQGVEDDEFFHGCTSATSGDGDETVELVTRCVEVNDSGTAYVRVEAFVDTGTCEPYTLFIDVH